ncbi:STAS domain-containing protein [Thermomonospora cellulosilytica]|uniref:Anti-sigma factor antagonist n=1 Tax=Thermomonospora cellulosilytica TaxID=1411118 RepID=A0A7W3MTF7_9ACTN|nr:STAS domain-containing protein [Thermomonospora cellulosilytica]MBA9001564.1 anti-anti-sigma factor [Thermomonospora cellulosilytica]
MRTVLSEWAQLDIRTQTERDGWTVVRITGELDLATAPRLEEHVTGLTLTRPTLRLVLDMTELQFCDSTGLGTLVALHRRLDSGGGRLVLVGLHGQPLHLLTRTGLASRLNLRENAEQATH